MSDGKSNPLEVCKRIQNPAWFIQIQSILLQTIILSACCSGMNSDNDITSVCSSVPQCKCNRLLPLGFFADCSHQNLTKVPNFHRNVLRIDLSYNEISQVPVDVFPEDVRYIDLSFNRISSFQNGSFFGLKELRTLILKANHLDLNDDIYFEGLFNGLTKLSLLDIKNNSEPYGHKCYPLEITHLTSLETLLVDGIDKPFAKEYSLLKNLKTLDIAGVDYKCSLFILYKDYFNFLPYLTHIDISSCKLLRIEKGTFQHLVYLQYLDISFNADLSFRVLSNVTFDLQFTNISVFKANSIHYTFGTSTELYIEDVKYVQNTSLKRLYLDKNRLGLVELNVLNLLPDTLEYASMADNKFTMGMYVLQTVAIKGLKEFNGSFQHTAHNPFDLKEALFGRERGCDNEKRPICDGIVPSYRTDPMLGLDIYLQKILNFSILFPLCKSVEKIHFSQCSLRYKIPKIVLSENNIKYADFSGNILYDWTGPILNVQKVKYLDLSNNYCSKISNVFFQNFTNLSTLRINDNILGFTLNSDKEGQKLGHLQALRKLDLSNNYIFSLDPNIFAGLRKLEFLNISRNSIREWHFDIKHMNSLKYVDLSYNQLIGIPENIRHSLDSISVTTNITLDLTGNNFMCSCNDLEFMKWFLHSKIIFKRFENYTCRFPNDTQFKFEFLEGTFLIMQRDCSSKVGLIAGLSAAILVAITVIVGGIVYRYRWKLRYLYYMTKSKYRGYSQIRQNDGEYEYDAFVSYADSDRKFVSEDMISNLEKDGGCRLCIHHRDFIPGLDIADNITNSIHKSNKTILILSSEFLQSYWCMFEFNMARMESIYSRDGRNVLFLIFYKDVPGKDLPLVMLDLIESQSYIEYPNDPQGNVVFWNKIKEALSVQ